MAPEKNSTYWFIIRVLPNKILSGALMVKRVFVSFLPLVLSVLFCTTRQVREEGKFSYQNLYRERYEKGTGGILSLTIERGESLSGSISPDGKYLYFASNRLGNYDIYLRALDDVELIPVTRKVTNQTEPIVSPDGKWLAYIDDELDPDGDLVVLRVDPESLQRSYEKGEDPSTGIFASKPRVLTNNETNRVRSRESNPAWSPDSRYLVFSSDMTSPEGSPFGPGFGAVQNLWLMEPTKPKEARQLTQKGGVMPAFSPDGKKIAYVSYEHPQDNGDIYELDLETLKSRRLTKGSPLDLSPTYSRDGRFLIFTRISRDTNGDGIVNRKDKGEILGLDLKDETNLEPFAMTLSQDHVFDNRSSSFMGGSLLLAQASGENINVGLIPESGVVPVRKSAYEQYRLSQTYLKDKNLSQTDIELYRMSLGHIGRYFEKDSYQPLFYSRALLDEYLFCEKHCREDLLRLKLQLEKEARQNPFLRYLVGYEKLNRRLELPISVVLPFSASSRLEYLRNFRELIQKNPDWQFANEKTQKAFEAEILYDLSQEEEKAGNFKQQQELEKEIIRKKPDFYRVEELLLKETARELPLKIPSALLFVLYGDKHPYFTGARDKELNEELRNQIRSSTRQEMLELLYTHFLKLLDIGKLEYARELLGAYPESSYPELHGIFRLAQTAKALQAEQRQLAGQSLPEEKAIPKEGKWRHLYKRFQGELAELEGKESEAYEKYYEALLAYEKSFQIKETRALIERTLSYYREQAQKAKNAGRLAEALSAFQHLAKLQLYLEAQGIEVDLVQTHSLETLIALNELSFADPSDKNKILKEINAFYDENMDFARRYLVNSFIFGRAHLKAQQGMLRHIRYEKEGITTSQKREVLKLFKEAEKDFRWSFFADPLFPDSYVMLGWMYQFIDTRREMVVDEKDNTKDKDKFAALYPQYFPNYLFEEGIRLYQKSIDFFKNRGNPLLTISFHLNMANNYFLLSNYAKAEENYEVVLDALRKNQYRFESEVQKALFFYHLGRTYYYTGKHAKAGEALEEALSLYHKIAPVESRPREEQITNRARHETIMRLLALNADLNNEPRKAMEWYLKILESQNQIGVEEDRSFLYLELARLYLDEKNYEESLYYLRRAEESLKKEKEQKPPRFKIRVRWLGFQEPWTTILSWIYQLPYDQVYVGENRLAFPLPTINRWQYLYSMEAEIFRQKGLLNEAKESLRNLQKYASQDKSKHGAETLRVSYMRLGEIHYRLAEYAQARKAYEKAKELAYKDGDLVLWQQAEKNLLTLSAHELEASSANDEEKLKLTDRELRDVEKFVAQYIETRLKSEEKKQKEKNKALTLSEKEKASLRLEALKEIYKLAIYQGVFHFYLAELNEAQRAKIRKSMTYTDWLAQFNKARQHFLMAHRFFLGLVQKPDNPEEEVSFIEKRDQGMRLALTFNRGRLFQTMGINEKAREEYKLAYDRANEFRSDRYLALAGYRLAETEQDPKYAQEAYNIFTESSYLVEQNPNLFEKITELKLKLLANKKDYEEMIRTEDLKRFLLARQFYHGKLRFLDSELQERYEKYLLLSTMEANRRRLIENLRLWRESTDLWEKELAQLQADKKALEESMLTARGSGQLSPIFYRLPSPEEQNYPILYMIDLGEKTAFVVINRTTITRRRQNLTQLTYDYAEFSISPEEISQLLALPDKTKPDKPWQQFLVKSAPELVVVSPRLAGLPLGIFLSKPVSVDVSLVSARLFRRNQNVTRKRLVQIASEGGFLGLGAGNKVKYDFLSTSETASNLSEWQKFSAGYSVLDYEAELGGELKVVERNPLPFYQISQTMMFPSLVIAHYKKDPRLTKELVFYYKAALNLLSASRGATAVIHLPQERKANLNLTQQILLEKAPLSTEIYGLGVSRHYIYTGEKTSEFVKLAELERRREFARLQEEREKNLEEVYARSLRARDAEELVWAKPTRKFQESPELFAIRSELLLQLGKVNEALLEWQERRLLLEQEKLTRELGEESSQMVARLFAHGFLNEAQKELATIADTLEAKDWLKVFEGYHLASLRLGDVSAFSSPLPEYYEKARQKWNISLPQGFLPRLQLFLPQTSLSRHWEELFLENLEYRGLYELYRINPPQKGQGYLALRAYILRRCIDPKFSAEAAANYLNRLEKALFNPKLLTKEGEEGYAERFLQWHSIFSKKELKKALELAQEILADPKSPRELRDAIYINLVWDLWMRKLNPQEEAQITRFISQEAKKELRFAKNAQRRFFLTLLEELPKIAESAAILRELSLRSNLKEPSSFLRSLMNRLALYSATHNMPPALGYAYFPLTDYNEDQEVLRRLEFIGKIRNTQNPLEISAKENWQLALLVDYLRQTGKAEEALLVYLGYDRNLKKLPMLSHPLKGLVSFYEGNYLLFVLRGSRVSWQTLSQNPLTQLPQILPEEKGFYYYLSSNRMPNIESYLSNIPGMMLFFSSGELPTDKREGYASEIKEHPLTSLMAIYNRPSAKPYYYFSKATTELKGIVNFTGELAKSFPLKSSENRGGYLLTTTGGRQAVYLRFSELLMQNLRQLPSVEEAFLATQKQIITFYPLPRDYLSVQLIRL
ncbi:MAG: hypothetical protein NZM25_06205 [Leptospiraceae bacterium]|nr:hypothetical protein [Leptospiraceae bacterium]MDW8306632.1 hypothetical protein [Leptospiraceae bacterium]